MPHMYHHHPHLHHHHQHHHQHLQAPCFSNILLGTFSSFSSFSSSSSSSFSSSLDDSTSEAWALRQDLMRRAVDKLMNLMHKLYIYHIIGNMLVPLGWGPLVIINKNYTHYIVGVYWGVWNSYGTIPRVAAFSL